MKTPRFFKSPGRQLHQRAFWRVAAAALLIQSAVVWVLLGPGQGTAWHGHITVDIWNWARFLRSSAAGLVPYVDYSIEYPTAAGLLYWLLSFVADGHNSDELLRVHVVFFSLCSVVGALLLYVIIVAEDSPRRAFWLTLLYMLLPTRLILDPVRFEPVVTVCVLAGYWFFSRGKPVKSALWWGLGCALKWYPGVFFAVQELQALLTPGKRRQCLRTMPAFLGVLLLFNAPILITAYQRESLSTWWQTYAFHQNRPLYWDTLLGVWDIWFGYPWIELYAGYWSLALVFLVLLYRPTMPLAVKGALICMAGIVFNRVYSTQFHLWFYPLVLIFAAQLSRRALLGVLGTLVVLDLLNVTVYPFTFAKTLSEIDTFAPLQARSLGGVWTVVFSSAICLRTVVLVFLAALLVCCGRAAASYATGSLTQLEPPNLASVAPRSRRSAYWSAGELAILVLVPLTTIALAAYVFWDGALAVHHRQNLIEAEELRVVHRNRMFPLNLQDTTGFERGPWSGNGQLLVESAMVGDFVIFELPVKRPGKYVLSVYMTKSYDYGRVQISVDDRSLNKTFDLFDPEGISRSRRLLLGVFDLTTEIHLLKIRVVGRNPSNRPPYYRFGIDGVELAAMD